MLPRPSGERFGTPPPPPPPLLCTSGLLPSRPVAELTERSRVTPLRDTIRQSRSAPRSCGPPLAGIPAVMLAPRSPSSKMPLFAPTADKCGLDTAAVSSLLPCSSGCRGRGPHCSALRARAAA